VIVADDDWRRAESARGPEERPLGDEPAVGSQRAEIPVVASEEEAIFHAEIIGVPVRSGQGAAVADEEGAAVAEKRSDAELAVDYGVAAGLLDSVRHGKLQAGRSRGRNRREDRFVAV
jgi:hypothetical protein